MSIIKDRENKTSSRRVLGIVYLSMGLVMALADQFTKFEIKSFEVWVSIIVTGGALLGLGLAEYFAKLKRDEHR